MNELEGLKKDLDALSEQVENVAKLLTSQSLNKNEFIKIRKQLTGNIALIQTLNAEAEHRPNLGLAKLLNPLEVRLREVLELAQCRQVTTAFRSTLH